MTDEPARRAKVASEGLGDGANALASPAVVEVERKRALRARNVAIGAAVTVLCVLIYAITIVKLGPAVLIRPL